MIKKSLGQILYEGRNHLGRWHLCNQSDWEQDAELVRIAVLEREGVEQLRARYANLEKENIRINEIIEQHAVRFDSLALENVRLQSKNTDFMADMDLLHNRVDSLTETNKSLELENEELTEQFLLADAAISQLRAELAQTKREGEILRSNLELSRHRTIATQHDLGTARRDVEQLNERIRDLELRNIEDTTNPAVDPKPVCRDCDGREIKVGDNLVCVNATGLTRFVDGSETVVKRIVFGDVFVCGGEGPYSSGRFRIVTPAEPTLVPWTAFAEIPLDAWYRHKSSTTSKKIRRIDGERLNFQDQEQTRRGDWLTVAELCEQYDYSLDGRDFHPCGSPSFRVE